MKFKIVFSFSAFLFTCLAGAGETYLHEGWEFRRGDAAWESVRVPHDWAIRGPFDREIDKQVVRIVQDGETKATEKTGRTGSLPWVGGGEYRRTVEIPAGIGWASIVFDGAMSEPEVFWDGRKVGEWKNGYNAFEVEVPPAAGRHELSVRLMNRPESARWYPGAGLHRPVRLVTGGVTGVRTWGTVLYTPDLRTVKVRSECRGTPAKIVYRVCDGESTVATASVTAGSEATLTGAFEPWSPESPRLYTLVSEVYDATGTLCETRTDRFGVRTIEYGKGYFALNGIRRKFKGVCLHHDLGPVGAAFNDAAFRRQVRILKEMGCDSIRTAHNMPGEAQLKICDEMGLMVMAESFDEWKSPKCRNGYNLHFDDWWRRDLVNLVRKGRSHPSVVMWSIGNEIPDQRTELGRDLTVAMQDFVHTLDPDPARKVTQGTDSMPAAIASGVTSVMEIPAVTYRLPFYDRIHASSAAGLMLGIETASTVSSRGVYKFPDETNCRKWHDDGQCSSYDTEHCPWSNLPDDDFAMQDDRPWTIGEFVWTGFDYLGEPSPYNEYWPSRSSYFGICDLGGIPKDRYWLYRSRWNADATTLHVLPHWNWKGREGRKVPVYVYTTYPSAELFVNGVSQGRRARNTASRLDRYRLRWRDVVYQPGELRVVAYGADGRPAETKLVRTAGAPARLVIETDRAELAATAADATPDLGYVTVTVVDAHGNVCPDAATKLSFAARGAVSWKAACNGDATSLEIFHAPTMHTFNGRLVALVEAGAFAGTGTLTISAEGLPSVTAVFTVK